jgi:hypothetical protein
MPPLVLVVAILVCSRYGLGIVNSSGSIVVESVDGGTTADVSGALTFKSGTRTTQLGLLQRALVTLKPAVLLVSPLERAQLALVVP